MIRLTCCQMCMIKTTVGKQVFSNGGRVQFLRWKSWSSSSRPVNNTKFVEEEREHQDVESIDLSQLKSQDKTLLQPSFKGTSESQNYSSAQFRIPGLSKASNKQTIIDGDIRNDDSVPPLVYYPTTVAETVQSVRSPYISPLRLVNATDPNVLNKVAPLDVKDLLKCYLGLSKSRLTGLVVVTAMAGYALAPASFALSSFLSLSLGTALTSAAANTVNQIVEVPYDSQMDRTKNRVLVRERLSKEHAAAFAVISGVSGITLLTIGANGLTAMLGGLNLLLYTCVYTPMKRQSIANTWVGSIVGGIPPLMGWVACTGEITHGALLLGGILYAWQFPHFNALSWNLRNDYNKAGYKMMAISHPELCRKTSLRYSLSLILISSLAPVCNVTSWTFVIDSLPLNGYLAYLAYKFYQEGDSASSRKLFRFSLIHLPTLILLMMVSKKAYKDKLSECPISAGIIDAAAVIASPPSPPVVFASISSDSISESNKVQTVETLNPVLSDSNSSSESISRAI